MSATDMTAATLTTIKIVLMKLNKVKTTQFYI